MYVLAKKFLESNQKITDEDANVIIIYTNIVLKSLE